MARILIDADLISDTNEINGSGEFAFSNLIKSMLVDLKGLSEEINEATEDAEMLF